MKALTNPIAIAALQRVIKAAGKGPAPRPKYSSRTADKYVLRGFDELFNELEAIGRHQGRSMNSEVVAAILEALDGYKMSTGMLEILKSHLGRKVAGDVLEQVPGFDLDLCKKPRKFVIRFPTSVRDKIRDGVQTVLNEHGGKLSMNTWILNAVAEWIRFQRQQYALLTTSITMNQLLLTKAE